MERIDLMLDTETTGKRAGCGILSIAVVPFRTTTSPLEPFYSRISLASCEHYNLTNDKETMAWWQEQSKEAQEEAFGGTTELRGALFDLIHYVSSLPAAEIHWWANGASFDFPILEAAFHACGLGVPWNFRNCNCYRTLKNLFPYVKAIDLDGAVKHNALWDAKFQAEHATVLLNWSDRCQRT